MNIFLLTYRQLYGSIHKNFTIVRTSFSVAKTLVNRNKNILVIGLIPVIPSVSAQGLNFKEVKNVEVSSNVSSKDAIECHTSDDEKTPWERVKAIYETDEFGNYSKELTASLQACYMAIFIGLVYGGVQKSRIAFTDFMERNQASLFDNHLDAKRKLQNHVSIHFGIGAFQWAWRLGAFTGGFMLLFSSFHAYRGTTSLVDYAISGAIVGALMRLKFGPPAIIVGGTLGGVLGLIGGMANQTMLSLYGASFDDVLTAQYNYDKRRTKTLEEHIAKHYEESSGEANKLAFEMLKSRGNETKDN